MTTNNVGKGRQTAHSPEPLSSKAVEPTKALVALAPEAAPLREAGTSAGGLAQHRRAGTAQHDSLGVREHGGNVEATLALHVHEEGVRRLHKALELVLALLQRRRGVKEIDVLGEHLLRSKREENTRKGRWVGELRSFS